MQRVLFVERQPQMLTGLALVVSRHCAVRTAPTMLNAMTLSAEWRPDLLVVDMPDDGIERKSFLFHLSAGSPSCPVIVLTGDRRRDVTLELTGARIDGLVQKPVGLDTLLASMIQVAHLPCRHLHWSVAAAISHVVARYADRVSLQTVAATVGASRTRLAGQFRSDTGMTMMTFLTRFRVEVAKGLLRATNEKLDAIASTVGFCDASHFSRVFQQTTQMRPGLFRREAMS